MAPPPQRVAATAARRSPASAIEDLRNRQLTLPVQGIKRDDLRDTFNETRGIVAAPRSARRAGAAQHAGARRRGRHDRAAVPQRCRRHHDLSVRSDRRPTCYYYAHLERYADGLEGRRADQARAGDRLRRHHRQRAARHAAPALRDLQADRREEVVAGDRRSIPIRSSSKSRASLRGSRQSASRTPAG